MSDLIGGRYQISGDYNVIGVGGMGTVYLGVDTQTGEQVALKQLRPEISQDQPEMIARFAREAEALARLNHPHIVKVLDTFEESPHSYIVMEYVSGGSLRDLLNKHEQLPVKQVLEIALDLSDALIRAHRLKILHRDIKPANVLLAQDGTPRLTDFGVAHLEDEPGVTRTGTVIGTLNYLSPEALNGFALDERSDIWAFGVMLYEMLAGHLPFDANTMTSLITTILTRHPAPLQTYRDDIPMGLELLIDKMLQKDRDERIDSMRQVGAELERIMRGEPTSLESTRTVKVVTGEFEAVEDDERRTEIYSADDLQRSADRRATEAVDISEFHPDGTAFNLSTTPGIKRSSPWVYLLGAVLGMGVLIVAVLVSGNFTGSSSTTPTPGVAPEAYRVVLARLEPLAGERMGITRAIVSDLREVFEQRLLYSNVRVITSENVVTAEDEALALAREHGAPVVVWGSYDVDGIDINLQLGDLTFMPDMPFSRAVLERSINTRLTLRDVESQSIAPYIASAFALLEAADGDVFEWARLMAVVADLGVSEASLIARETFATHLYRYALAFATSGDEARRHIDIAIGQDGNNALLYWLRAMRLNRSYIQQIITSDGDRAVIQELFNEARRNQVTARRIAPANWVAPNYSLFTANVGGALRTVIELASTAEELDSAIEARPDLWAPIYFALEFAIANGEHERAVTKIGQMLALNPNVSLPYTTAILYYLRQGQLLEAGELINQLSEQLPDAVAASRMFDTLFGVAVPEGALPGVLSSLLIGQYQQALATADRFLTSDSAEGLFGNSNNMLLLASIAQCNLQDFNRARFGLNNIVSQESGFMFARLVRANVNLRSANAGRAESDFERILNSEQADALAPFVQAVRANAYHCGNLFDLTTISAIPQQYARQND